MIALRFKALQPLSIRAFPDTAGHWAGSVINAVSKAGYVLGYPDVTTAHWAYGQVEEAGTSHGYVPASDRTERWMKTVDSEID